MKFLSEICWPALLAVLCLLWASIPSGVHAFSPADTGDLSSLGRVALVIGNSTYKTEPLRNPENDAREMAATLQGLDFEVILKLNQDRFGMREAIRDFGDRLQGGKVGVFYYAGHGVQVKNLNYLIPVNADIHSEDEVPEEAVAADMVLNKMENAGNPLNLVILDACRNNPFPRKNQGRALMPRGLARMAAPGGTMVMYATRPGQVANDGRGKNSPFTRHLVQQMQVPGLEVGKMIRLVAVNVEQETGGSQTPWTEGILKGDFFFRPGQSPQTKPRESPDQEMWDLVKNSDRISDLETFVRTYPNSEYIPAASMKISQMQRRQVADSSAAVIQTPDIKFQAYGNLTVSSTPSAASVRINGKAYGTTPRSFDRLGAGEYRIEVSKKGYQTYTARIRIEAGQSSEISAFLEKNNTGQASLSVSSNETGASVQINGREYGKTPFSIKLAPGYYRITVYKEGYEAHEEQVKISTGRSSDITAWLRPIPRPVQESSSASDSHSWPVPESPRVQDSPQVYAPKTKAQGEVANFLGMRFAYIPPGEFTMGSPGDEEGRDADENLHTVRVTKGFYLQITEVTQGQWKALMGNNPSGFADCGEQCPAENVSWQDAVRFIKKLNEKEHTDRYRLPTEAEWEYACRAGSTAPFSSGTCLISANFNAQSSYADCSSGQYAGRTFPAASFPANALGLYDMHGNVWEWCQDVYGTELYADSQTDPLYKGKSSLLSAFSSGERVSRGGSWSSKAGACRSANRVSGPEDRKLNSLGFRVARDL